VTLEPPVLVLADGQVAPRRPGVDVRTGADSDVFDQASSALVIDVLRAYLSKHFADRVSMHGVFMDILGLGVLITGESGWAKASWGWN
jgi:HPr kinase/phosphorylase